MTWRRQYPIGFYLRCPCLKLQVKTYASRPYFARYQNCQPAHDFVHFEHFQFEGLSASHHPEPFNNGCGIETLIVDVRQNLAQIGEPIR